jgi:hypothetical protein
VDLAGLLDFDKLYSSGLLFQVIPIIFILFVLSLFLKHVYDQRKLKPIEKRIGADLHTDIVGVLEKIYLAYDKKGFKIKKYYPRKEDILIIERRHIGNAWLVRPKKAHNIRNGDVGKIYVHRAYIWMKEDRLRVAAKLAAWWFNIYFYTIENKPLGFFDYVFDPRKLPHIERACDDTLRFAGLEYLAKPISRGNIDHVRLITDHDKIEEEHRRIAKIGVEDLRKIRRLRAKESLAFGEPEQVHHVAMAEVRHVQDLIYLGKKELDLLKKDATLRKQLGTSQSANQEALERYVTRLEVILPWLQMNVGVKRQDKEQQRKLSEYLKEFESIVLDVPVRLEHLDEILSGRSA